MINDRVQKYVGVKYKLKGETLEEGMDCVTLLIAYYRELGTQAQEQFPDYEFDGHFILTTARKFNDEIAKLTAGGHRRDRIEDLKENDLIFFSISGKDRIELAAAYLGDNKFLYMPHVGKSCISSLSDYWTGKFRYGLEVVGCL